MAEINREMEERIEKLREAYAENEMQDVIDNLNFDDTLELINAYRNSRGKSELMELTEENFNEVCYGWSPWDVLEELNGSNFDPDDGYFTNDSGLESFDDIWYDDEASDIIDALMSGELEPTCFELREALDALDKQEKAIRDSYNTEQCIKELSEKAKEMSEIYHKYHASGKYLAMFITRDVDNNETITLNNRHWGEDENFPIKCNISSKEDN